MKFSPLTGAAMAALLAAGPALAEPNLEVQPIQSSGEVIRYFKGVPTVELERDNGIVRLTPLPFDHGSLAFAVTVYNDSTNPANFGIFNVSPRFGGGTVQVFSRNDLERKAKNRAFWSQFGIALLGATASGLAASSRETYSSSLVTPRGTYRSFYTVPSIYGQYQAAAVTGLTVDAVGLVQYQLDRTLAALGDDTIQLTTLEPGESYAGRIVLAKINPKTLPVPIALTINWNGEVYPFEFQLARPGTPPPPVTLLPRKSRLTAFDVAEPDGQGRRVAEVPSRKPVAEQSRTPTVRPGFGNGRVRCVTCVY